MSDSGDSTLFTLLPASQTNVKFANNLHYTEDFNPYTYRNFYNGGGVGMGDINNDGMLDLFFCGNQVDSKLYLNKGNFQFEDITDKSGVACHGVWASGVAFVDLNGDGLQDIYICKSGKPGGDHRNNELFINQGNLVFKEQSHEYGLDNIGLSTHAAFFDYDRDGDLDCYLLNNSIRTVGAYDLRKDQREIPDTLGGNKLLRNDHGHFTNVSQQAGIYSSSIGFGLGVSVADLNGDTWPDLYISNDFFERDYLYINQKDGTFKESLTTSMPEISLNSMGADIADINNDALPEVFVTDMLPETNARYKTKTTFENWEKYQRNVANGYHHQFIRNALQLNRGDLHFTEISRLAGVHATDWSWGALIFDMDMDGYKDIFVANGIYKDLTDQDYLNFYNDPETIRGMIKKEKNVITKLIDAIPSEKISNYAFHNNQDLTFTNRSQNWGLSTPSFSNGSAYGDLDNDGDLDLVINNDGMPCFMYRNNTIENKNANYLRFDLKGTQENINAIGSQITIYQHDKRLYQEVNPMRGFESCVDPRPLFGLGKDSLIDSITIIWPNGKRTFIHNVFANQTLKLEIGQSEIKDQSNLSPDNALLKPMDIPGLDFIHQENEFNDFERDRLLFHMISREGPAMAMGDVNGDHLDDIYLGNALNAPSALYIQSKNGSFTKSNLKRWEADKGSEDTDAAFFDADQDGDLDLYVCSGGNELPTNSTSLADRLYINDGKGNFTKANQILPTFNFESTSCVKKCDYDHDGDQDLFVGVRLIPFNYGVPCNGYILNNDGHGKFTPLPVPDLEHIGMITDAAWADIDGDKFEDLIISGEWMTIIVLKNKKTNFKNITKDLGLNHSNGLWQTVVADDLDHDGDIDILAGNWGLNTRIKSSQNHPAQLFINDYDQNGTAEQILTTFNGDKDYPLTLKQDLVVQMPLLKKKYLKYEDYKNQTINDVFAPEQLKNAIHLICNTTATTLFINDHGKFTPEALPIVSQLSPVFTVLPMDLNHDGLQDLILGGNFSAVKPELGGCMGNAMTVLIQTKDHHFKTMNHPGNLGSEIRSIKPIRIKGTDYIMIANNNANAQVYAIQ